MRYHIIFLKPSGKKIEAPQGERLLPILLASGVRIRSDCGGRGICGHCRVRFLKGAPPPTEAEAHLLSPEELEQGWRLACQHKVESDIALWIPPFVEEVSQEKVRQTFQPIFPLRPKASLIPLFVNQGGPNSALEKLKDALKEEIKPSLSLLRQLPGALEDGKGSVTFIRVGRKTVSVRPGSGNVDLLGLAVDVGTSTLAAYLLDLREGKELGAKAIANPQISFGTDVISRITYVRENGKKGLEELREAVVSGVNHLVKKLCLKAGAVPQDIVHAVFVGNPTMLHLLLGIDPSSIGEAPFAPVWKEALSLRAKDLDLMINAEAVVDLLPFVSGYVGADTVACLLACRLHEADGSFLLLDIGTNGEIVLGIGGKIFACSTAAGPAFEGGRISCGMPALPGAVSHVSLQAGGLRWEIIGEEKPRGICGSGLVDLLAILLQTGLVNSSGRLVSRPGHFLSSHIVSYGNQLAFQIANTVSLTQRDIRELQLDKAAIRAGIEVLLEYAGGTPGEIETVYLAGSFGSQMRPESLVRIGLFPKDFVSKIRPVGNAAGLGAVIALLDCNALEEADEITKRIKYIELSRESLFSSKFVKHLHFPN